MKYSEDVFLCTDKLTGIRWRGRTVYININEVGYRLETPNMPTILTLSEQEFNERFER